MFQRGLCVVEFVRIAPKREMDHGHCESAVAKVVGYEHLPRNIRARSVYTKASIDSAMVVLVRMLLILCAAPNAMTALPLEQCGVCRLW